MILCVALTLTFYIVARQWQHFEIIVPYSIESGAIQFNTPSGGETNVAELIQDTNRKFASISENYWLVGGVTLVFTLMAFSGTQNAEIFSVLVPSGVSEAERQVWYEATHANWWADFSKPGGSILYLVSCFAGVYVTILQNVVGLRIFQLIWKLSKRGAFGFSVTSQSSFGWDGFKIAFRTVQASLYLHGMTLAMLVLILLGPKGWPYIAPLLLLWVFVLPCYMIIPRYLLTRSVKLHKQELLKVKLDGPTGIPRTERYSSEASDRLYRSLRFAQLERDLTAIPIRPLGIEARDIVGFAIAILPILLAVAQVVVPLFVPPAT